MAREMAREASAASAESQWDVLDAAEAHLGPAQTLADVREEMRTAPAERRSGRFADWRESLGKVAREGDPGLAVEALEALLALTLDADAGSNEERRECFLTIVELPVLQRLGVPRQRDFAIRANRAVLDALRKDRALEELGEEDRIAAYLLNTCESILTMADVDADLVECILELTCNLVQQQATSGASHKLNQRPLFSQILLRCVPHEESSTQSDTSCQAVHRIRHAAIEFLENVAERCLQWRDDDEIWVADSLKWVEGSESRLEAWLVGLGGQHREATHSRNATTNWNLVARACAVLGLYLPTFSPWGSDGATVSKGVRVLVRTFQHLADDNRLGSWHELGFFAEGICFSYSRLRTEPAYLLRLLRHEQVQRLFIASRSSDDSFHVWAYIVACLDIEHMGPVHIKTKEKSFYETGWDIVIQPGLLTLTEKNYARFHLWLTNFVKMLLSPAPENQRACSEARKARLFQKKQDIEPLSLETIKVRANLDHAKGLIAFVERMDGIYSIGEQGGKEVHELLLTRFLSSLWAEVNSKSTSEHATATLQALVRVTGLKLASSVASASPLTTAWPNAVICHGCIDDVLAAKPDDLLSVLETYCNSQSLREQTQSSVEAIAAISFQSGSFASQTRKQRNADKSLEERLCTWLGFPAFQRLLMRSFPPPPETPSSNNNKVLQKDNFAAVGLLLLPRENYLHSWYCKQLVDFISNSFPIHIVFRCASQCSHGSQESKLMQAAASKVIDCVLDTDLLLLWSSVPKSERASVFQYIILQSSASPEDAVARLLDALPRQDAKHARELWITLYKILKSFEKGKMTLLPAKTAKTACRNDAVNVDEFIPYSPVEQLLKSYFQMTNGLPPSENVVALIEMIVQQWKESENASAGLRHFVAIACVASLVLSERGPEQAPPQLASALLASLAELKSFVDDAEVALIFTDSLARRLKPLLKLANKNEKDAIWTSCFASDPVQQPQSVKVEETHIDAEGFVVTPMLQQHTKKRRRIEHLTEHQKEQRNHSVTVAGYNNLDASQLRMGTFATQSSEEEEIINSEEQDMQQSGLGAPTNDESQGQGKPANESEHVARKHESEADNGMYCTPRTPTSSGAAVAGSSTARENGAFVERSRSFRIGETEELISRISTLLNRSMAVNLNLRRIQSRLARSSGKLANPEKQKTAKYENDIGMQFQQLRAAWIEAQRVEREFKEACAKLKAQMQQAKKTHRHIDFSDTA